MSRHSLRRYFNTYPLSPCLAAAVAAIGLSAAVARGQSETTIVRVEEDWELVVTEPDSNVVAPQVVTAMSPVGHVDGKHATFEINHQNLPEFIPGGLQLQMWCGEYALASRKFPSGEAMAAESETVTWTQAMEITHCGVLFEVTEGDSSTWGEFGGQGYLRDTLDSQLSSLNGYSPSVSVAKSGVSYASNRVQSLVLKRVRYYTADGEVEEDTNSLTVFEHEESDD